MSLFDKDIVERSIDYIDDPEENIARQIARALIGFNQATSGCFSYMDSVYYVKNEISDFMQDLLNEHTPKGFLGPFKKIKAYWVSVTHGEIPIIKVGYRFKDIDEYKEIQFVL